MDWGVGDAQERRTAPNTLAPFLIAVRDGLAIQSAFDPTRVPDNEDLAGEAAVALPLLERLRFRGAARFAFCLARVAK
jgi:hypothetical protein